MDKRISLVHYKSYASCSKTFPIHVKLILIGFCMLAVNIPLVQASICPSSTPGAAAVTTELCSFQGYTTTWTYRVIAGKVSSSLYFLYYIHLSPSSYTTVTKVDVSGSQNWMVSFSFDPAQKSLAADVNEQSIYLAVYESTMAVLRLSSSNGAIENQKSFTGIRGYNYDIKIWPLVDNSAYFVIGHDSSFVAKICKYTFASLIAQCQSITKIIYGHGQLMISQTQFLILGSDPYSPYNLHMYKITFNNTSVDWANMMVCSSGTCSVNSSESLLSEDGSTIYSLFTFGSTLYLYFASFSTSNGSVISNRYKSSVTMANVFGSAMNADYIIASTQLAFSVVIYDLSSSTFMIKHLNVSILFGCAVEPSSGSLNSNFTADTWSMTTLSSGTADITSESGVTIDSMSSFTPLNSSYSSISLTYVQGTQTTSDVYYQISTQLIYVVESYTKSIVPDLSCSFSGSTAISYNIISSNGSSLALSWITIDSSTGMLTITAPNVNADTEFSFYVTSSIPLISSPIQKLIKIKVLNCQVQNCQKCSSTEVTSCAVCNSWYTLQSGSCVGVSETSQALTTTTASLVGATFCIVTIMNLINSSSMINLWAMVNQVQLFLLFILTRAFIPPDVKNIITGVKFTLNITPYIYLPNIGLTDLIKEEFDSPLSNQDLSLLNINSDSSIINVFPIISLSLMIALFHMFVTLIYKFVPAEELQGRCKLIKRQSIRVINKLFSILTFSWYIRYMFESNQYVLISCINEISMFNLSDSKKTVSFVFSICLLCFCLWLILFISCLSLSSYEVLKNSHNKFGEIFHGVKMQRKNKFYVPVLFIRRAIFVILLMTLTSIQSWILISILSFIQLCYLVFIIILRPFEYIKDNIIEISNEIFFCILLSILIFFNSEENWSPKKTEVYIWIITSNSIGTFIIILADFIRMLTLIVIHGCPKSEINANNSDFIGRAVSPSFNNQSTLARPVRDASSLNISKIESRVKIEETKDRNQRYISDQMAIVIEEIKVQQNSKRIIG